MIRKIAIILTVAAFATVLVMRHEQAWPALWNTLASPITWLSFVVGIVLFRRLLTSMLIGAFLTVSRGLHVLVYAPDIAETLGTEVFLVQALSGALLGCAGAFAGRVIFLRLLSNDV